MHDRPEPSREPGSPPASSTGSSRLVRITSPKNPQVKWVQDAATGKQPGLMVAEGRQVVREALETELPMRFAAISPRLLEARDGHDLKRRLEQRADLFADCTESVFDRMSSLTTPPGVLAVLDRPSRPLDGLVADVAEPLVVVSAGLRDPGNLGGVVRTAEAAGADGMVVLEGGADPFRDKAVRGSMGSVLRLPIASGGNEGGPNGVGLDAFLAFVRSRKLRLLVLDSSAGGTEVGPGFDIDLKGGVAVVLGGEAHGVPAALREAADGAIRIPMRAPVDSLNVSVTAGVVLYEAWRQRRPDGV